jgi:hypothetical protein
MGNWARFGPKIKSVVPLKGMMCEEWRPSATAKQFHMHLRLLRRRERTARNDGKPRLGGTFLPVRRLFPINLVLERK